MLRSKTQLLNVANRTPSSRARRLRRQHSHSPRGALSPSVLLLRRMVWKRIRHFGHIPCPRSQQRSAFVNFARDYLVECVGLTVMCLAVMGRTLHAEICRNALVKKWLVVRCSEVTCAQRLYVEDILQRPVDFSHQRRSLVEILERDAKNFSRARIEHQQPIHLWYVRRVVLQIELRAVAPLFLAREQNEGKRSLGLPSQQLQRARCLKHRHRSGAIVERTLAQIP